MARNATARNAPGRSPRSGSMPVRWKIAALAAACAGLVAATVGVMVHVWTRWDIQARAEAEALNKLYSAVDTYRRGDILADGVRVDPPDLPSALREPPDGERHSVYDGRVDGNLGPSMWAAQRVGGPGSKVLAFQVNMGPQMHGLERLDMSMTVASLAALAVVTPLAVLGSGVLGRRLHRVSQTAGRISAGDLDARTGPTKGRDEISGIAAAVDAMADGLARQLHSERRFTADVAHELRTPVGGLLAAADLLPAGETEDALRARIRDLRDLVEDLLEVSRLDAGAEQPARTSVPLDAVVREAVARTGLPTEVVTTAQPTVRTDPRRLERIVGNLVVNAHRHGRTPVEVTVAENAVTVRDHGPGFPADLLREGPRRFRTGARERGGGHGLGLTIALGQARVLGAELRLGTAEDEGGGAVAALHLPRN
ncbi:HAMP domain-containing sensor histidine kinase [Streptomyces venezuelae]